MTGIFVAWSDRADSPGWIEDGTGCQIWIGANNGVGYGMAWADGKVQLVHRARYEREVGPIPEGLQLDHFVCSNPGCCNPRHVRPVSQRENNLRSNSAAALNRAKTRCPQGHPYSGDNLYVDPQGRRECKQCRRDRTRAYRARRKASTKNPINHEAP